MVPLGYAWLIQHLQLQERSLAVTSQLGTRLRTLQQPDGSIQQQYPPHYVPETSLSGHLEFALKHEGVNLSLLRDIFLACGPAPIEATLYARPTGKYSRLLGFYYELTTGQTLNPALTVGGNYIAALWPPKTTSSHPDRSAVAVGEYWTICWETDASAPWCAGQPP